MSILRVFRPMPYPSVALFALVMGFFGSLAIAKASGVQFAPASIALRIAGIVLLGSSLYLVISFARGLILDLSLGRQGLTASARITSIEARSGGKGYPRQWWLISYTFVDERGVTRAGTVEELDQDHAGKWKVGDSIRLRYHPEEPSIFRWLD
jgi:hypothetical protein